MAARKASAKSTAKPNVSAEELLNFYREMLLIRRFTAFWEHVVVKVLLSESQSQLVR